MLRILRLLLLSPLLWMAWSPAAGASDSMRCGSRLLQVEARAAELLAVCGEPSYRDVWAEPGDGGLAWVSGMEEWYYNFGSSQLLRVVKLRNARVVDIDADGYGFAQPDGDPHCSPDQLIEGISKYRLLSACGAPLTRTAFRGFRPPRQGGWYGSRRDAYGSPVYREEWVYNFGSRYLMRVVTIENGRVSLVENGERGADRR